MPTYQESFSAYSAAQAQAQAYPKDPVAAFNVGWWGAKLGKFSDAIAAYEQSIALGLSGPEEAMVNIASIYSERLGDAAAALEWLGRALETDPLYYPALFNRAHLAEQLGDRDTAVEYFARASKVKADDPLALTRLVEAMPMLRTDDPHIAKLRHIATKSSDADVFYALAKVEERLGQYSNAWRALQAANACDAKAHSPWQQDVAETRYRSLLSQPLPPLVQRAGQTDNAPVFIVGMFRTGSTLLEQLLAAHSRFFPLGESEFWPRAIAQLGGSMIVPTKPIKSEEAERLRNGFYAHMSDRQVPVNRRVTDKRPDNLYHLPMIAKALPEARFIITERDWRDTLLSVWATRLHPQHAYATNLANIRAQLQVCKSLSDHWRANHPDRVYRFRYEDLMANPEVTMRALLDWLGEPWDPDCLSFHRLQNPVRTASVWQIREPLMQTRQQRWVRYEAQLRQELGTALDQEMP